MFEKDLIIEVDGGQHAENLKDQTRDRWLAERGYKVLRFWNNDVLSNREGVLQKIIEVLNTPSPALPSRGREVKEEERM